VEETSPKSKIWRKQMRIFFVLVLWGFVSLSGAAQDNPRAEVYGGYSYLNFDINDLSDRQSVNGWEASVSGNFNKWLAIEGGVSGYYKGYTAFDPFVGSVHADFTDYFFGAGPRINFRPAFIHGLFGANRLTGSVFNLSASDTSIAGVAGGGVEIPVASHWSVRASGDYFFTRHFDFTQNHFRAGAGIVYRFGGGSERGSSPPGSSAATVPRRRGEGMVIAPLGIRAAASGSTGAEVEDIAPGSVAELAGLKIGDVINAIDGKPVRTPMELASELSAKPPGTKVELGMMIRGMWQTTTTVILGSR
jgi:hypothetical protein